MRSREKIRGAQLSRSESAWARERIQAPESIHRERGAGLCSATAALVLHWNNPPRTMKPTDSQTIRVRAGAGDYFVKCRRGILRDAGKEIFRLGKFSSVHIVTSPKVWQAVGKKVRGGIPATMRVQVHQFADGEAAKNLQTVEAIARRLVRAGADRKSLLIALGGGVVGDVVGFVAASYLRGVPLVQVPTTVVAQVDSAVGGKTGVNLPEGKNLVGAFYPPRLVLVDPEVLSSLPGREFRGGLAEVIKYGVIADAELFAFLEKNLDRILSRDAKAVERAIRRSIEIKADVVSRDETESGLREILNYGHTFAHALESVTRYRKYQHGEAVAWGMMCAALLGHEAVKTPPDHVARIIGLVRRIGPLPGWPDAPPQKMFEAMRSDKKANFGTVRFVLSPRLGVAKSYDTIEETKALCVLRFGPKALLGPVEAIGKCHG
jgi:3-dehydroquinate synthase